MVVTLESLTVADLKAQFGRVSVADPASFPEGQGDRPPWIAPLDRPAGSPRRIAPQH